MTAILGLNSFHADSAACLLIDGKLVGAVAEERLGTRRKHTSEFPANAIRWLLADNGLKLADITHLAVPRDARANRMFKAAYVARNPLRGLTASIEHLSRSRKMRSMIDHLADICGENRSTCKFEMVAVEHHLAHIASAYYSSPFDGLTAGFSYDASGDFTSAMAARCEGHRITIEDRVTLPDSMGFFYSALCQFIGFEEFGEEYKVMGLAPYGEDTYRSVMRDLVELPLNGWFRLNRAMFQMPDNYVSGSTDERGHIIMPQLFSNSLSRLLGPVTARGELTQREKDIARSTQIRFEEAALHCLTRLHKLIPTSNIVMAGGCALNGVANARILRDTPFTTPYLQAAASDDGTCLGAALWAWHNVLGRTERFHMKHAFWGPGYSDERHRKAMEATGLNVELCADEEQITEKVADLVAAGNVTGWYQGRSEWGPRALGNRSILANPAITTMKETINAKIKRRESFRPFAPSVLTEDVNTYFEQSVYSPFMMHVVKIRSEWRERLPAITHIDGTGRLQSVDYESNPLYHRLISAVKRRTGVGMVLNTSFNENEPIVDTPEQAVDCFMRTEMDSLCVGRYIVRKPICM